MPEELYFDFQIASPAQKRNPSSQAKRLFKVSPFTKLTITLDDIQDDEIEGLRLAYFVSWSILDLSMRRGYKLQASVSFTAQRKAR